jgi:type IV pilus assembly protein PilM
MGLFSTNYSYLGVNIGASSIKLVELADDKGTPKLATYGFTEQSVDIIKDDSDAARNEAARILKHLFKESKATGNKVITALPTFSVFTSVISLPQMNKKDLAGAVRWEAKKIIPMPLEEIVLNWNVINDIKTPGSNKMKGIIGGRGEKRVDGGHQEKKKEEKKEDTKVLITGAPKKLVSKYMDIFQRANLSLLSLETEVFALIRSLVGNDKSTLIIVDLGAKATNISLVQNGLPVINRSIELGGNNITQEISQNLDISVERAEQFKSDMGISDNGGNSSVFKSIENTITPIIDEINYTIDFFKEQLALGQNLERENIEKIILTGGSSLLSYLPDYLSQKLNKKVYLGDPWARIVYPEDLKPIFEEIGPKLSVPIGLAMREIV